LLNAHQLFDVSRRAHESRRAAMAGDDHGFALHEVEQLPELILGFG
jgi:hypothetical protein